MRICYTAVTSCYWVTAVFSRPDEIKSGVARTGKLGKQGELVVEWTWERRGLGFNRAALLAWSLVQCSTWMNASRIHWQLVHGLGPPVSRLQKKLSSLPSQVQPAKTEIYGNPLMLHLCPSAFLPALLLTPLEDSTRFCHISLLIIVFFSLFSSLFLRGQVFLWSPP